MEIIVSRKADKILTNLNEPLQTRIIEGIFRLPDGDVKKMQGRKNTFRLRVGSYRIVYEMADDEIHVEGIFTRGKAY